METAFPPWQLTTSELDHAINMLETSPDEQTLDAGQLAALYQERAGRKRLAARLAETAGQQTGDGEPW